MIKNKKDKGFTLIELMVVIAIITLLSSVILASLKEVRDKAIATKFKSEMQQFVTALELYKTDTGKYPYEGGDNNGNPYQTNILNNNTEYLIIPGLNTLSDFLIPKYLPTLPKIPLNTYTNNNAGLYSYAYLTNGLSGTIRRCVGDINPPPYTINISSNNSFISGLYKSLPFNQWSDDGGQNYSTGGSTRCISPK